MIDFGQLVRQARAEGVEAFVAGVVVLDAGGRALMLRRKPDDHAGGQWEFPGGSLDPGEDPQAGAARELAEETGLTGLDLAYLRAADFTGRGGVRARHYAFTATVPDGTPVTLTEHDAHRWSPLDDLPPVGGHHHEILDHLRRRRTVPGWQPVGRYLRRLAVGCSYGALHFTDHRGHPFLLHSAHDPGRWQFTGGDTDAGESPWDTALRETREELGLDPARLPAERRLLAVLHHGPGTRWPLVRTSYVFDGGVLDDEQLHRIRLSAEHTDWAVDTLWRWRARMRPDDYRRLLLVDRARRSRTTLYAEQPLDGADEFEGVLVLVTTPDRQRVLLNLRDDLPGIPWPGHWAPIGGWREGHESAQECAVREIREEAGITVSPPQPLDAPRHPLLADTTAVLHAVYDGPERALVLGEGQAVRFVPRSEVPALRTPPYLAHYLARL